MRSTRWLIRCFLKTSQMIVTGDTLGREHEIRLGSSEETLERNCCSVPVVHILLFSLSRLRRKTHKGGDACLEPLKHCLTAELTMRHLNTFSP